MRILILILLVFNTFPAKSISLSEHSIVDKVEKIFLLSDWKFRDASDPELTDSKKEYSFYEIQSSKNASLFVDAIGEIKPVQNEFLKNARRVQRENDNELLGRIIRRLSEGEDRHEEIYAAKFQMRQYRGFSAIYRKVSGIVDDTGDAANLQELELKGFASLISLKQMVSAVIYNSPADLPIGFTASLFSAGDQKTRVRIDAEYDIAMDDSYLTILYGGKTRSVGIRGDTKAGVFDIYADASRGFYYSNETDGRIGSKTEWGAGFSIPLFESPPDYYPTTFLRRSTEENIGIAFYLRFIAGLRRQYFNITDITQIQVIERSSEQRYAFDLGIPFKKGGLTAYVYAGENPERDFSFGKLYGCSIRIHYAVFQKLYVTGEYAMDSESQTAGVNGRSKTLTVGVNKSF